MLTALVPAFNETATIQELLRRVLSVDCVSAVVVVDDGSTDGTPELVAGIAAGEPRLQLVRQAANRGKGAAIRRGLQEVETPYVVVQDADLEYDPAALPALLEAAVEAQYGVCFGSRYLRADPSQPRRMMDTAVRGLNATVRMLYGVRLSDEATCLKLLPTDLLRALNLKCERFEFCPEVVAKLCRAGIGIVERPITYRPRSVAEGKKLRLHDGREALATLWRYRRWEPNGKVRAWKAERERGPALRSA